MSSIIISILRKTTSHETSSTNAGNYAQNKQIFRLRYNNYSEATTRKTGKATIGSTKTTTISVPTEETK